MTNNHYLQAPFDTKHAAPSATRQEDSLRQGQALFSPLEQYGKGAVNKREKTQRQEDGMEIYFRPVKARGICFYFEIGKLMSTLGMEGWIAAKGKSKDFLYIDECARLIAEYLEEHSFKSLDQKPEMQKFLMSLMGWGENPKNPGTLAALNTERLSRSSPLYHKARAIYSISESWTRLVKHKICESYLAATATTQ